MKAVTVHGPLDLRVEERPDPVAGPGEVLVAVEWGGVCGSDVAYWRHGRSGTATLRHPLVLGHEFAGTVVALGEGVAGIATGTAVTVQPGRPLPGAVLPPELAGRENLLPVSYFGSAALDPHTDGGFCGLKAVPADQVHPLPAGVGTRAGAVAEPLAVAMHAVHRAGDVRGREVLVNGTGPIGALVVAALRHAGAGTVVAADPSAASLEVAKGMGADVTVDLSREQLPADVPVVVEASGAPAALGAALRATARGGTLVQVGNLPGVPAEALLGDLVTREITWRGSFRFAGEFPLAVAALGEGLDVTPVLTHSFDLDEAETAVRCAADRSTGSSKVTIRIG